jgi:hypothetical protein
MANMTMESALFETIDGSSKPELLVSAALYLMSHYSTSKAEAGSCARLAAVIERHLKALAAAPDLAPVLQATCLQLSEQWSLMVEHSLSQPAKPALLTRLTGLRFN